MRYDDIEIYKSMYVDNQKILGENKILLKRLEKLANNSNLKYLNFKVIAISVLLGVLLGSSLTGSLMLFKQHKSLSSFTKPVYDFDKTLSVEEFKKQNFEILDYNTIKVNSKVFKRNDVINGFTFVKTTGAGKVLFLTPDLKPLWLEKGV